MACRVAQGNREGLRDRLIDHVRTRMPSYKVPARWFLVDEFPRTPTGKVQRFALRDAILEHELHEL